MMGGFTGGATGAAFGVKVMVRDVGDTAMGAAVLGAAN
jgi:hypothetical protein